MACDMLLSLGLNAAFNRWLKGPLDSVLMKTLGRVKGSIVEAEILAAVSQVICKVAADVAKKLSGKLGKSIVKFLIETVIGWYGRTNPGMQEKYIVVFEKEAPLLFAAYMYQTWLPEIRAEAFEVCSREFPDLDASPFQDATPEPSFEEYRQAVDTTIGAMLIDATRGLLSGDQWEKLLADAAKRAVAEAPA